MDLRDYKIYNFINYPICIIPIYQFALPIQIYQLPTIVLRIEL